MILDFEHIPSGHCENGVITNLLNYHGIKLSEPMVFGIGSGLFFAYLPFVKINGSPGSSFRPLPGMIFQKATQRLNIEMKSRTYRKQPRRAMKELDDILLNKGLPVGLQVGVFHLPYFPPAYRFHFNSHNIAVFGKEDGVYHVSDPVMDHATTLTEEEMRLVRYAKGVFAPKGRMYYPISIPEQLPLDQAIYKGLKHTTDWMLNIPIPLFGAKGIGYLGKRVKNWEQKFGSRKARIHLAQVVRMLEEIGTGGAGFRFIYAAFLQEAADIISKPVMNDFSKELTQIGDDWRVFSYGAAQLCKNRNGQEHTFQTLGELLIDISAREEKLFSQIRTDIVKPHGK